MFLKGQRTRELDWTARKKYLVPERKEERSRCVVLSCVKKQRNKVLWPIPSTTQWHLCFAELRMLKKSGEGKGSCQKRLSGFFPLRGGGKSAKIR